MAIGLKVWQISPPAASQNSVAEFFLRHGVALLYPGDRGPWTPDRYAYDYAAQDWMRWFAETMSVGDAILLRTGARRICAVGVVASEYKHDERFDDVHGFDLQHCRRVRWYELPEEYDFGESAFTRGRFSSVRKASVRDYVYNFLGSPPVHWQNAPLPELPGEEPQLAEVPQELQGIVSQAQDLAPLYRGRQDFGENPTEDEIVAHFVVPFLRALGWQPEQIGVKWKDVDIVLFAALPRRPENCHLAIEAKRLGAGVEGALKQAKGYLRALGILRDVVVTDGVRYRMYAADDGFASVAYANLVRLKQSATKLFSKMKRP